MLFETDFGPVGNWFFFVVFSFRFAVSNLLILQAFVVFC